MEIMYPTLSDYLEKAKKDYKKKVHSKNDDYLIFQKKESEIKKVLRFGKRFVN